MNHNEEQSAFSLLFKTNGFHAYRRHESDRVMPSPATHVILIRLKAGECIRHF